MILGAPGGGGGGGLRRRPRLWPYWISLKMRNDQKRRKLNILTLDM